MSLYISINTPSPTLDKSPIDEAITFMATQVAVEKRNGRLPQSGPVLDVTFMLSVAQDKPSFKGMRMGGYTDENNTLYFETAVPVSISHSTQATRYVTAVLHDVVDHAARYFTEQDIPFDSAHWLRAVNYFAELEDAPAIQH